MNRDVLNWARLRAPAALFAALAVMAPGVVPARAADIAADGLKFAADVVKAPAYESPPATYIVANASSIFSDHSFTGTKVMGELKRGDRVEALAKVKGWDWILVGKDGTGIGYVAISMLSPADKYVP
jgi:hypothetical protein